MIDCTFFFVSYCVIAGPWLSRQWSVDFCFLPSDQATRVFLISPWIEAFTFVWLCFFSRRIAWLMTDRSIIVLDNMKNRTPSLVICSLVLITLLLVFYYISCQSKAVELQHTSNQFEDRIRLVSSNSWLYQILYCELF